VTIQQESSHHLVLTYYPIEVWVIFLILLLIGAGNVAVIVLTVDHVMIYEFDKITGQLTIKKHFLWPFFKPFKSKQLQLADIQKAEVVKKYTDDDVANEVQLLLAHSKPVSIKSPTCLKDSQRQDLADTINHFLGIRAS
jgi:hypothetical protein